MGEPAPGQQPQPGRGRPPAGGGRAARKRQRGSCWGPGASLCGLQTSGPIAGNRTRVRRLLSAGVKACTSPFPSPTMPEPLPAGAPVVRLPRFCRRRFGSGKRQGRGAELQAGSDASGSLLQLGSPGRNGSQAAQRHQAVSSLASNFPDHLSARAEPAALRLPACLAGLEPNEAGCLFFLREAGFPASCLLGLSAKASPGRSWLRASFAQSCMWAESVHAGCVLSSCATPRLGESTEACEGVAGRPGVSLPGGMGQTCSSGPGA